MEQAKEKGNVHIYSSQGRKKEPTNACAHEPQPFFISQEYPVHLFPSNVLHLPWWAVSRLAERRRGSWTVENVDKSGQWRECEEGDDVAGDGCKGDLIFFATCRLLKSVCMFLAAEI